MSTLDHQSQTYRSSSKLYNPQLCNLSSQPLPRRSHSLLPSWLHNFHKELLRPHRINLHKVANSTPSLRPFQKKTKLSRKEQVTAAAPPPPPPPPLPPTLSPWKHMAPLQTLLIEETNCEEVPPDLRATLFLTTFDVWPFERMQILPDDTVRYRLTREERERLKFLGLENYFNTSWPKPDPVAAYSADAKGLRKNSVEKVRGK